VIAEFEDDLLTSRSLQQLRSGREINTLYQKILALDLGSRYKLELVVKDRKSERIGVLRKAIVPPAFREDALQASSLVLSDAIERLREVPDLDGMFILGDVKVRPSLTHCFSTKDRLGLYFQVYNAGIDQSHLEPLLTITYRILRGETVIGESVDSSGESVQFFSGGRAVLINSVDLEGLEPGDYEISIKVLDRTRDEHVELRERFRVELPAELALN
jgi:hypothetical protein